MESSSLHPNTLLITIEAFSITTKSVGYLSITKHSSSNFSVRYADIDGVTTHTVDINAIQFDVKNAVIILYPFVVEANNVMKAVPFKGGMKPKLLLLIENRQQLQNFISVFGECMNMINFTLELGSRLRDIYFAGVYSQLQSLAKRKSENGGDISSIEEEEPNELSEEKQQIYDDYMKNEFFHEIEKLQSSKRDMFIHLLSQTPPTTNNGAEAKSRSDGYRHSNCVITNQDTLKCFYCTREKKIALPEPTETTKTTAASSAPITSADKQTSDTQTANPTSSTPRSLVKEKNKQKNDEKLAEEEMNLQFYLHPYVPKSFSKEYVMMCSICIENWKEYRDSAIYEQQLILPGEVNEEVCALCSDIPESLTLCSYCSRSYCKGCLQKVLSATQYGEMFADHNDDTPWKCMACYNKFAQEQPLLSRSSWKVILSTRNKPPVPPALRIPTSSSRSITPSSDLADGQHKAPIASTTPSTRAKETAAVAMEVVELPQPSPIKASVVAPEATTTTANVPAVAVPMATSSSKNAPKKSNTFSISTTSLIHKRGLLLNTSAKKNDPKTTNSKESKTTEETTKEQEVKSTKPPTVVKEEPTPKGKKRGNSSKSEPVAPQLSLSAVKVDSSAVVADGSNPAPSDESFYFAQYVHYIELLHQQMNAAIHAVTDSKSSKNTRKTSKKQSSAGTVSEAVHVHDGTGCCTPLEQQKKFEFLSNLATDDACYLCKDGGDVIECDWTATVQPVSSSTSSSTANPDSATTPSAANKKKPTHRCYKVYHEYCLNFGVDDSVKKWICPRHFCSICGVKELSYMCQYCPVSLCKQCPEQFVKKYGLKKYVAVHDPLYEDYNKEQQITTIACESCLNMIQSIAANPRFTLPPGMKAFIESTVTNNTILNFPGEYGGEVVASTVCKSDPPKKVQRRK